MPQPTLSAIVLTGVESTGKTELARALAEQIQRPFIAEYARQYLEDMGTNYHCHDVENIARTQTQLLRQACLHAALPVVCDTDALVCKIWFEHKYRRFSPLIDHLWQSSALLPTLYILPHLDDCPYVADPLRETPLLATRQALFLRYLHSLQASARRFIVVRGSTQERLRQILNAIR